MQKCFYHPKTDATTMCMGCKMPICATCQAEGKKGFCDACVKKVASLADRVTDMKKTGMVAGNMKATMIKTSGRPTALKNVTYCFHHFDIVAAGTCPNCSRPFCPACLNSAGVCSHCATHDEAAQARMFTPSERGRAYVAESAETHQATSDKNKWIAIGLVVVVLLVGLVLLRRPAPAKKSMASTTLEKLKSNELSAEEQALLQNINQNAKNSVALPENQDAPPAYTGSGRGTGSTQQVLGHAPAAAGGGRLYVALTSPRSGATISGLARVHGVANNAEQVEFFVDGESIRTAAGGKCEFDFATHSVANGSHRLTLVAQANGRQTASSVVVNVRN